jgi:hypothetical protein
MLLKMMNIYANTYIIISIITNIYNYHANVYNTFTFPILLCSYTLFCVHVTQALPISISMCRQPTRKLNVHVFIILHVINILYHVLLNYMLYYMTCFIRYMFYLCVHSHLVSLSLGSYFDNFPKCSINCSFLMFSNMYTLILY